MLRLDPSASECYAEALCLSNGWVTERVFRNQYLIAPESETGAGLPGWAEFRIAGLRFWHDPDLPSCQLYDETGVLAGILCGVAIGPDDQVVRTSLMLPFRIAEARARDKFEEMLMDVRGRYVVLLALPKQTLLYTDPVADMGAVFDAEACRVGLSVTLVLKRRLQRGSGVNRPNLIKGRTPLRAGFSPDAHIRRVLPNHRLNLKNFTLSRFWPRIAPKIAEDDAEQARINTWIAQRLGQNIATLTSYAPSAIPISGGMDSRIILALAAAHGAAPTISFTHRTNWISGYDAILGQQIAEYLGVPYRFLDATSLLADPSWLEAAMLERWLAFARSGFCRPVMGASTALALLMAPDVKLILRGNVMEMLGGRFHESSSVNDLETAFQLIWGRKPASEQERHHWQHAYCGWLADLTPNLPEKTGLDLAFVELLYSHAMAVTLQSTPSAFYMNPFADRRLIEATMRVPSATRRAGALYNAVLAHGVDLPARQSPRKLGHHDNQGQPLLARFLENRQPDLQHYIRQKAPDLTGSIIADPAINRDIP